MLNHIAFIRMIKQKIPFRLRIFLIRIIIFFQEIIYMYLRLKKIEYGSEKKIYLLLSTDYSNLGDHAMSYAHIQFLKKFCPEYKVVEILVNDTMRSLYSIKKCATVEDIITLKGGANVGIEYFREELIRRKIIKYFPHNKVIMFPQTVYFPNTSFGEKEFFNTIKIFNSNPNFYAFFRDRQSFEKIYPYFHNSFLVPDIVLSLGKIEVQCNGRKGAVMCMRSDVEGIYTEEDKQTIYTILKNEFGIVYETDTIRSYKIERKNREKELYIIWEQVARAEMIITDRLHGMIFAALLGTPCIVLNTYNHKVCGQYEWFRKCNYISYTDDLSASGLKKCIYKIKKKEVNLIEEKMYEEKFIKILDIINYKVL